MKCNGSDPNATEPPQFCMWLKLYLLGKCGDFPEYAFGKIWLWQKTENPKPLALAGKPAWTVHVSWCFSLCYTARHVNITVPSKAPLFFICKLKNCRKIRSSVKRKNKSTTKTSQSKHSIFLKSCFDEHLIFSQKRFQWKCCTNYTEKPLHKEMFQFPFRWQLQNKGHKKSYIVTTYHSWLTI